MNRQIEKRHTILLGSVGGDSHSVGLTILRQALVLNGYQVRYLGAQNELEEFFRLAALCNVVMISNMDGHIRYYLQCFPELTRKYHAYRPLWYLGGNLHIGDGYGYESYFREMGFDRVFVKFVDVNTVLTHLEHDLREIKPVAHYQSFWEISNSDEWHIPCPISDEKLEVEVLKKERAEVLEQWKTGRQARSLHENAEYLGKQKMFSQIQSSVNQGRVPILIQPRSGVALVDEQIRLFKTFKDVGSRVLSYQVDSLTRNNNYAGVDEAIRESREMGVSTLNGFPVVNYGVDGLRRIIAEIEVPLQTRHSTRDPRLLAEISYAGGVTAFEGGSICYNIPYYKNYPLSESIRKWQYVDRLTGYYYEKYGICLDREFFGTLTATLIPPCIAISVNLLETILAVSQGVKCVSLGYAEQGNRIQDIAAIRTLRNMAEETIENLGYKHIQINTVFQQYMAAFPNSSERAEELIYHSGITAALSGATRIIIKTPVEAFRIPALEDNLRGIELVTRSIGDAGAVIADEAKINEECSLIRREVQSIIDSVMYCGNGNIAEGIVKGFQKGYLDVPFSPSLYNRGEVLTARDVEGSVRFLSTGSLQFDRETQEFHRDKANERRRAEGITSERQNYLLIERDVMRIPRGQYEGWPLAG